MNGRRIASSFPYDLLGMLGGRLLQSSPSGCLMEAIEITWTQGDRE